MLLRPKLACLLASFRRRVNDNIAQWRLCYRPRGRHFHPSAKMRYDDEYRKQWNNRNFASTILPRNPRVRKPREPQTVEPIEDEEKKQKVRKSDFLANARETIFVLARIAIITSVITTLLAAYLITRLTHTSSFPTILRKGIEFLGPIFIKFGQWVSTRRDIFPRDVCDTLSRLQRNATPHPWLYTERLLKETYGPSWRDLFVKFDDEGPIGSGCCAQNMCVVADTRCSMRRNECYSAVLQRPKIDAQVYKAWIDLSATQDPRTSRFVENRALDESDEFTPTSPRARKLQTVAVKVLHPGIEGQLKRDIAIMRGLSKCVTYLIPKLYWLSLTHCIDEFTRIMEDQVDMRLEATNLLKFSINFSKWNNIVFPYPYTHLTRHNILVESFHEGSPISDYLEHEDTALQRRLARMGIATVLKMIFKDNFIHCDLHPGNILVEKAVVPKASLFDTFRRVITPDYVAHNLRLIILDCGLVVSLSDRCRQNLRDVFYSVLMGNGEMAAQYILEHSSHMTPDPDGFKYSIKNIIKSHFCKPFNVNVSTVVSELFSAMVRHRVKQDGSFSGVILSMLVIEGLGRCLDPNIDIFMELLPYVLNSAIYNRTNKGEILNGS